MSRPPSRPARLTYENCGGGNWQPDDPAPQGPGRADRPDPQGPVGHPDQAGQHHKEDGGQADLLVDPVGKAVLLVVQGRVEVGDPPGRSHNGDGGQVLSADVNVNRNAPVLVIGRGALPVVWEFARLGAHQWPETSITVRYRHTYRQI